ncbi:hypothetical protein [Vibrio owensii]|uniref:hypothetical protein n=1 Tax=Vibrio harveyi group TaxID=717610 RepID=UPI003CC5B243
MSDSEQPSNQPALFDSEGYLTELGAELDKKHKKLIDELIKPFMDKGCKHHEIIAILAGSASLQVRKEHISRRNFKKEGVLDKPAFMEKRD